MSVAFCDHCGARVRTVTSLSGVRRYRHDDALPDHVACWCETPNGHVRVSVAGREQA